MNYATIKNADIANGYGVRVSLFVSGCDYHCKGCFNEQAWDYAYGEPFTQDVLNKLLDDIDKPFIQGLSILGGEPLSDKNVISVIEIIDAFRQRFQTSKDLWIYTGGRFEELMKQQYARVAIMKADVVVDGRFEIDKKDPMLLFKGSSNQRVIDVKQTIEKQKIIELVK